MSYVRPESLKDWAIEEQRPLFLFQSRKRKDTLIQLGLYNLPLDVMYSNQDRILVRCLLLETVYCIP
jgi:hypothetical protein